MILRVIRIEANSLFYRGDGLLILSIFPTYKNIAAQMDDLGRKDTGADLAKAKIDFSGGFVAACRVATEGLSKDLNLSEEQPSPVAEAPAAVAPAPGGNGDAAPVYDLRGVMCPLNYVKTKLKLEMMDAGERLEVWLDSGDPIKNVPMSLRNDGHKVLSELPLDADANHYKVLVEKVEE